MPSVRKMLLGRTFLDNYVKDILSAVDRLLEVSIKEEDVYKVSEDQRKALQSSEMDIVNGKLISDEDLNNEEDEWLRA